MDARALSAYLLAMSPLQRLARHLGPRRFLKLVRVYPPYLGAGVRVRAAADDLSRVEVELPLTRWNQNYFGTHFGGSLYSMCDPFLALMLTNRLGRGYVVWDKAASIEFVRPGRGTVRATFVLADERVAEIRARADAGERVLPRFTVDVVDDDGELVARVEKTLYVRRADARREAAVSDRRATGRDSARAPAGAA